MFQSTTWPNQPTGCWLRFSKLLARPMIGKSATTMGASLYRTYMLHGEAGKEKRGWNTSKRRETALADAPLNVANLASDDCKATIVIEQLIQASDVAHTDHAALAYLQVLEREVRHGMLLCLLSSPAGPIPTQARIGTRGKLAFLIVM
eukprot:scaffold7489_cov96-Cylindrotheca_fusiformis.AAC.5